MSTSVWWRQGPGQTEKRREPRMALSALKRLAWKAHAYVGRRVPARRPERLTVLMALYDPFRATRVDAHARQILRCDFVERLVFSNHNPGLDVQSLLSVRDPRVQVLDQPVERGCGFRWAVAAQLHAHFLLVIDDDILLWPQQIARVFEALLHSPDHPHGISGLRRSARGTFEFVEGTDSAVDFLCEVYGVTAEHVAQYGERGRSLAGAGGFDPWESPYDFALVSSTGPQPPHIHDVGRVLKCSTFKSATVAVHQKPGFWHGLDDVWTLLRDTPRAGPVGRQSQPGLTPPDPDLC